MENMDRLTQSVRCSSVTQIDKPMIDEIKYRIFCCSILKDRKPGNGGVAQLGEHLPCKQGVMGSNPIISTTGRGSGAINRLNLTKLSGRDRTTKMNEGESRVRGRPR